MRYSRVICGRGRENGARKKLERRGLRPNLIPPVITSNEARMYRDRILAARPVGSTFNPLMTLYLTDKTDPNDVSSAFADGLINAVKYYPAGATTNSESGVTNINNVMPVLEKMAEIGLTLCIHGEVTDPEIDIFDREAVFIDKVLNPLRLNLPELKTTSEHITTKDGVDYVKSQSKNHAASITTHHMMINRNHLLVGGIKPHYYCLPVVKREEHRLAIRRVGRGCALPANSVWHMPRVPSGPRDNRLCGPRS